MSKIHPPILTVIHDQEVSLYRPTSEQTKKKIVHNLNHLGFMLQIGSIIPINVNQAGVTLPDPGIYQLCNDGEITHPYSPLRTKGLLTRFTPDYNELFPRISSTTNTNPVGGNDTFNLSHDHTGSTLIAIYFPFTGVDGDERRGYKLPHVHPINTDLNTDIVVDFPAAIQLAPYMKIG